MSPELRDALAALERFEKGAWRLAPQAAAQLRSKLHARVKQLGGKIPGEPEPHHPPTPRPAPPSRRRQPSGTSRRAGSARTPSRAPAQAAPSQATPSQATPSQAPTPMASAAPGPGPADRGGPASARPTPPKREAPSRNPRTAGRTSSRPVYRAAPPPEPEPVALEPMHDPSWGDEFRSDDLYGDGAPERGTDVDRDDALFSYDTEQGPAANFSGDSPYVSYDEPIASPSEDYNYVTFDDPPAYEEEVPPTPAAQLDTPEVAPSWLVLHAGTGDEQAMRLETDVTVGRGRACTVRVKDSRASRQHCRLARRQGVWWLEDLGSSNGTLVNGDFVPPEMPHRLHSGDLIVVGSVTLRFEWDHDAAQYAS